MATHQTRPVPIEYVTAIPVGKLAITDMTTGATVPASAMIVQHADGSTEIMDEAAFNQRYMALIPSATRGDRTHGNS